MSIGVKKRIGESFNAVLYRFNKKLRRGGILREARKRRFHERPQSKVKRRESALHREQKTEEFKQARRYGQSRNTRRGR